MMKKLTTGLLVPLITSLSLLSCDNDNDDLPKEYVGFEHTTKTVECDKSNDESEIQIKIIAIKKSDEDRTLQLSTPPLPAGHSEVMRLTEKNVIIKAGKKSATTTIKIYPKRMVLKRQNVTISCTPQWKEGKMSQLTIQLQQK